MSPPRARALALRAARQQGQGALSVRLPRGCALYWVGRLGCAGALTVLGGGPRGGKRAAAHPARMRTIGACGSTRVPGAVPPHSALVQGRSRRAQRVCAAACAGAHARRRLLGSAGATPPGVWPCLGWIVRVGCLAC